MKTYKYILLFLLISLISRIYYVFFRKRDKPSPVKNHIKEGFVGFESFDNCLEQGYPKKFCNRVPLEACITNCPVSNFIPKKFNVF
jgi:hypothetical protein